MIDLEVAMAGYKRAWDRASFASHPKAASAFYADGLLGAMSHPNPDAQKLVYMMAPFVYSEGCTTAFLFYDFGSQIVVSRITDDGDITFADWGVPYTMSDDGELVLDVAVKCWSPLTHVVNLVASSRVSRKSPVTVDSVINSILELLG